MPVAPFANQKCAGFSDGGEGAFRLGQGGQPLLNQPVLLQNHVLQLETALDHTFIILFGEVVHPLLRVGEIPVIEMQVQSVEIGAADGT